MFVIAQPELPVHNCVWLFSITAAELPGQCCVCGCSLITAAELSNVNRDACHKQKVSIDRSFNFADLQGYIT